jgi:hypothetical protein
MTKLHNGDLEYLRGMADNPINEHWIPKRQRGRVKRLIAAGLIRVQTANLGEHLRLDFYIKNDVTDLVRNRMEIE